MAKKTSKAAFDEMRPMNITQSRPSPVDGVGRVLLAKEITRIRNAALAPAAHAVDRQLRKNTEAASATRGYDLDARAIARVLVRHYGDEAEAVLKRAMAFLDEARRSKR